MIPAIQTTKRSVAFAATIDIVCVIESPPPHARARGSEYLSTEYSPPPVPSVISTIQSSPSHPEPYAVSRRRRISRTEALQSILTPTERTSTPAA